ncbi:MAG TPA: hypothetical protein VGF99_14855, partial [Myxococcota bacterium]
MTRPWPATVSVAPYALPLRRPIVVAAEAAPIVERRGFVVRVTSSDPDRPQHMYGDACPLPGLSHDTLDDVQTTLAVPFAPQQQPHALDWALYAAHCWNDEPCSPPSALLLGDGDDGLDAVQHLVDG